MANLLAARAENRRAADPQRPALRGAGARLGFGRIVQSGYPILGALCAALLLLLALPARQDASMSAR